MKKIFWPQAPYDMKRVMLRLGANPQYKFDVHNRELSFAVRIKRQRDEKNWNQVICFLVDQGTVDQPKVEVEVIGHQLDKEDEDWLWTYLTKRFQWDSIALPTFYQAVQKNPQLASLTQHLRGLPLTLDEGTYEGMIQTIISQQINMTFARQLVVSLSKDYGNVLEYEGHEYPLFPTVSQLAKVEVDELRTKKFSQRKAEYIIGITTKIDRGELDLEALSQLNNETILNLLVKERGIGVWTVECLLMSCLGRPDLFPAGDLGIRNALKKLQGLDGRPSIEESRQWAKPYYEWGSYLAIYLWEYLGNNTLLVEKK